MKTTSKTFIYVFLLLVVISGQAYSIGLDHTFSAINKVSRQLKVLGGELNKY